MIMMGRLDLVFVIMVFAFHGSQQLFEVPSEEDSNFTVADSYSEGPPIALVTTYNTKEKRDADIGSRAEKPNQENSTTMPINKEEKETSNHTTTKPTFAPTQGQLSNLNRSGDEESAKSQKPNKPTSLKPDESLANDSKTEEAKMEKLIEKIVSEEFKKNIKDQIDTKTNTLIQNRMEEFKNIKDQLKNTIQSIVTEEVKKKMVSDGNSNLANDLINKEAEWKNKVKNMIAEETKKYHFQLASPRSVSSEPNGKMLTRDSSRLTNHSRHTQGRQANDPPCKEGNEAVQEVINSGKIKNRQGSSPIVDIEGAESNILPQVKNTSDTTVLPTTEINTQNTTANISAIGNTTTIRPLNTTNKTIGTTTVKSFKLSTKKGGTIWKKLLKFCGPAVGVFTVLGGAFYIVYSVM
ncbi:uncharacterized protein LOC128998630 isoform X2 [Macrosteles quadrilineatus]|uniref:uncharacterized protein LOC128982402 isoform X2 n=1 Tax=Macrosteles quadrilineatus TaxID=74068 RepID=UPI0023E28273|nr:uncharacterized protein LOC128982402 isoform X2 [Macrosteles quadrilineatus]XP_054280826.1 uncharacterized protein LOC128998630 isoform X2 [Macrosteles quadrilineatus]